MTDTYPTPRQSNFARLSADLDAKVPEILDAIAETARLFGLKMDQSIYHYALLQPRGKVLLDYLGGCPAPPHDQWGMDIPLRMKRISEFIESPAFLDYCASLKGGGAVISLNTGGLLDQCLRETSDLPRWVHELKAKIPEPRADADDTSLDGLVTMIGVDYSAETLKRHTNTLYHEWVHLLFFSNGLAFQKIFPDDSRAWLMDEGLATWLESRFATGKQDTADLLRMKFQELRDRGAPETVFGYYEKGEWFCRTFLEIDLAQWPSKIRELAKPPDQGCWL